MACRQCCRDALELLDGRSGDARDPRALARALRALAGALEGGAALEDRPCERHLLDPLARLGPELFLRWIFGQARFVARVNKNAPLPCSRCWRQLCRMSTGLTHMRAEHDPTSRHDFPRLPGAV